MLAFAGSVAWSCRPFGPNSLKHRPRESAVCVADGLLSHGGGRDGVVSNFVSFRPRRQHVLMELKIPRSDEVSQRLQEAGMNVLTYRIRSGLYALQLDKEDLEVHRDLLRELIQLAPESYGL